MIRLSLLFLASIMVACSGNYQSPNELLEAFEEKGHRMKLGAPYSGVMLVAKDDSILLHKASGYSNWEDEVPNKIDNKFPIASMTKQFTAMLTMIQVEEGNLHLDTPIVTYLPQLENDRLKKVTLHQLLSHTSGLPHYEGLVSLGWNYSKYAASSFSPAELVSLIDQCSLRYTPGEGFYYSSLGYILVGAILEEVSGKSYAALLKEHITDPLGMDETGYASNDYVKQNVVAGYDYEELYGWDWWKSEYGGAITETNFRDQSGKFSTGGIHSTVHDLWKWSRAIRNRELISAESYDRMLKPNAEGYGYGWIRNWDDLLERNTTTRMIMHSGALDGYRSTIAIYDDGITIISLSNIQPMRDKNLLHQVYLSASGMKDEYELEGYPEWPDAEAFEENGGFQALNVYFDELSELCGYDVRPSYSSLIRIGTKFLYDGQTGVADSIFSSTLSQYEVDGSFINQMGYQLLEEGFCDQAITLFDYNIQKDSLSANAWDSIGDAYRICGDATQARAYYKKAVERAQKVDDPYLQEYEKHLSNL